MTRGPACCQELELGSREASPGAVAVAWFPPVFRTVRARVGMWCGQQPRELTGRCSGRCEAQTHRTCLGVAGSPAWCEGRKPEEEEGVGGVWHRQMSSAGGREPSLRAQDSLRTSPVEATRVPSRGLPLT